MAEEEVFERVETEDFIVAYLINQKVKDKVFDAIISWCLKYELFSGESIMQSDKGTFQAPVLLSDIIDDILKFEIQWK